jgi:predicted nucleic acid-binding protein
MTRRVYVDTDVLIAIFETTGPLSTYGWSLFNAVEAGRLVITTSEFMPAEVLPRPLANGDTELVKTYQALLSDGPALTVVAVSRDILVAAAGLRAADRALKLPDAIHLATALAEGCGIVVSNDRRLTPPQPLKRLDLAEDTLRGIEGSAA